jgi:selenide,water dikinase
VLDKALASVEFPSSPNALVDASTADDAGIYQISEDLALIQTTDFFPPVVDDPYLYGQIAATNALSDVYAMGGLPLCALNILCFPDGQLDNDALRLILQGGADKVKEADAVILGGHSVSDKELKYGLAVTGKIRPTSIKINHNLKIGDNLLLTKPLGTGILTTALKSGLVDEQDIQEVISSMLLLNRAPARLFDKYPISACTDVTGYGLLGHLWEMLEGLACGVNITVEKIPFFKQAVPYAQQAIQIPGGTLANQRFIQGHLMMGSIDAWYQNILFDPQTSGGLLISIPQDSTEGFITELSDYPMEIAIIGKVVDAENKIFLE